MGVEVTRARRIGRRSARGSVRNRANGWRGLTARLAAGEANGEERTADMRVRMRRRGVGLEIKEGKVERESGLGPVERGGQVVADGRTPKWLVLGSAGG